MTAIDDSTPVVMLTVGQLRQALRPQQLPTQQETSDKEYVYGLAGIAKLFNCSMPTAFRIKSSGKIDKAIKQIGRKIIVDAELALELAGKKEGGRG